MAFRAESVNTAFWLHAASPWSGYKLAIVINLNIYIYRVQSRYKSQSDHGPFACFLYAAPTWCHPHRACCCFIVFSIRAWILVSFGSILGLQASSSWEHYVVHACACLRLPRLPLPAEALKVAGVRFLLAHVRVVNSSLSCS